MDVSKQGGSFVVIFLVSVVGSGTSQIGLVHTGTWAEKFGNLYSRVWLFLVCFFF